MFDGAASVETAEAPKRLPDAVVVTGDPLNTREAVRLLLARSGLCQAEVARRMGRTKQTIQQTVGMRKPMTTVKTLAHFAAVCGGRVIVELPE